MKLYYAPGACSLAPHIVLREANLPFKLDRIDLKAGKKTQAGESYVALNPKGYVPALELDDGQVLTEGAAILQYLADRNPDARLAPRAGTIERARLHEWLNYIATEVHKGGYSPLFNPKAPDEWKQIVRDNLAAKLDFLARHLERQPFLLADGFSVADAYLFTILRWSSPRIGVELGPWPALGAFIDRVGARPAVKAALEAEKTA